MLSNSLKIRNYWTKTVNTKLIFPTPNNTEYPAEASAELHNSPNRTEASASAEVFGQPKQSAHLYYLVYELRYTSIPI